MKKFLVSAFMLNSLLLSGQDGKFNFGARSSGLAGASLTLDDPFSLFNNVGGLGRVEDHYVFAGYQNRFGISEFQVLGAGALYSSDIGTAGLGIYKFGDDLFSQQRIHFGIGNQFQLVSLGLGIDLIQYNVATIGTKRAFSFQFGGVAEITPQLFFGAHIFNLNQVDVVNETGEKVPTVMKAGISFRPTTEVMVNVEVEKDLDFDEIIKVGLEYQVIDNVFLRTGISTQPFLSAFGVGFHPKRLLFDYSFSNTTKLGNIHEITLGYSFAQ